MSGAGYVFIVDDNTSDLELALIAFEEARLSGTFETFSGGEPAKRRLLQLVEDGSALPDTVLLDLNMPGMSGFEVLAFIKGNTALRAIRTLILTTSNSPLDRQRCQQLGADGFLVKPTSFVDMMALFTREFADGAP